MGFSPLPVKFSGKSCLSCCCADGKGPILKSVCLCVCVCVLRVERRASSGGSI